MTYIEKTHSTNSVLIEAANRGFVPTPQDFPHILYTFHQTAGRGQAGNSWESETGKNLLFSVLLHPNQLRPDQLFRLTQWVSIVVYDVLSAILCPSSSGLSPLSIKWPNDIYYGDKKLCGILIETAFAGAKIDYAVAGVGVNVNQTHFVSDAPNPISLYQIINQETDLHTLMQMFEEAFIRLHPLLSNTELLHQTYLSHLYRREGWHTYLHREVSTAPTAIAFEEVGDIGQESRIKSQESGLLASDFFRARFVDILPNGCLVLAHKNGTQETFHFKEIRFVL